MLASLVKAVKETQCTDFIQKKRNNSVAWLWDSYQLCDASTLAIDSAAENFREYGTTLFFHRNAFSSHLSFNGNVFWAVSFRCVKPHFRL